MYTSDTPALLEVGVDYITATSRDRNSDSGLYSFGRWLVAQEVAQGSKRNTYRAQGYRGDTAGRAAVGISYQGAIVRCSSDLAREHWSQCYQLAHNVSRLDVQATVQIAGRPSERIGTHFKELKRARRTRGKRARFKMQHGPDGPESCSLGNRLSDRYGRVYDKGLESGKAYYDKTVRYELELHRRPALETAHLLDQSDLYHAIITEILFRFFTVRGLVVPELSLDDSSRQLVIDRLSSRELANECGTRAPDIVRAVKFMRDQVGPCVQRLREAGQLALVLESLGLTEYVQIVAHNRPENGLFEES